MDSISPEIARYVAETKFGDLNPAVISSARRSTLDTFGAMLAGSSAPGIDTMVEFANGWGGNQEATLIGVGRKVPAPTAAWCNGAMARAMEIDDCVDFLPVHPSASAVPALLSLAESRGGLSGKEFVTALATGQDLIIRMGLAVRQSAAESGRNNLFNIFGPTAAVARALRLEPDKAQHALGISFSHAVGDGQCVLDGALTLRLQQGIFAQGALLSALLAEKDFTGARDFLLGKWGYLRVFEPDPRLEYLTEGLGQEFYGERTTIKPFSSCRATHPAIDLAMTLAKEHELDPVSIKRIAVRSTPEIHNMVASPHDVKAKPDSVPAAQFSIQFTVATSLIRGDMFLAELDPVLFQDRKILALANRVRVEPDPTLRTDSVMGRTVMDITSEDGTVVSGEVESPLGSPKRPLSYEACAKKFRKCAEAATQTPKETALQRVIDKVATLEELEDVSELATDLNTIILDTNQS